MASVATLLSDLRALDDYVASQRVIPGINVAGLVTAQVTSMVCRISSLASLDVGESNEVVKSINAGSWTDEQKVTMCNAVNDRLLSAPCVSQTPQSFSFLESYLSTSEWAILDNKTEQPFTKHMVIVHRLRAIGLHNLDEKSFGHVVGAIIILTRGGDADMPGPEKLELVRQLKNHLRLQRGQLRQVPYLRVYPRDPKDLPPSILATYKDDKPVTRIIPGLSAIRVPLRSTNRDVTGTRAAAASGADANTAETFFKAMMSMFQGQGARGGGANINILRPSPPKLAMAGADGSSPLAPQNEPFTPPRAHSEMGRSAPTPLQVAGQAPLPRARTLDDVSGLLESTRAAFMERNARKRHRDECAGANDEDDADEASAAASHEEGDEEDMAEPATTSTKGGKAKASAKACAKAASAKARAKGASAKAGAKAASAKAVAKAASAKAKASTAKTKAPATGTAKKAAAKATATPAREKKPPMPVLKGTPPSVQYNGGRIYIALHRQRFRVLRRIGDRVDVPVSFSRMGSPAKAWTEALRLIDEQRASEE